MERAKRIEFSNTLNVSQKDSIESLEHKIQQNLELSSSLLQDNALEALNYATTAKEIAEKSNRFSLLPDILIHMGNAYKFIGEYPKAILTLQKAVKLARQYNNLLDYSNALKNLGIVYKNVGEYHKSLECYLECLKVFDEMDLSKKNGSILSNIGNLYRTLKNYDKAIDYHLEALSMYEVSDPISVKAGRLINIGVTFYEKNDLIKALEYYENALQLTKTDGPDLYSALCLANIGLINLKNGEYNKALEILNEALEIFTHIKNIPGQQNALLDISKIYRQKGDFNTAISKIESSLELAEKLSSKERLRDCYEEYFQVCEMKGDFENALKHHKKFTEIKDAIIKQMKIKQIAELETKSALEKLEMKNEMIKNRNEELKGINEELEQFAYAASHDLKEPLRMIKSYITLLEKREGDKLEGDSTQFMHFITDGADRMEKLLTELLEYSRIGREKMEFETVDLNKILDGVLKNLSSVISDKNVNVKKDILPVVTAFPTQMTQLFQNLISNGIKFNKGGDPVIEIHAVHQDDKYLFKVVDNGIGIDPKYRDGVFQIFKRLNRRDEFEGTGIGLSTCKKIVERHSGSIWFESQPGEGTTFYFTIPKVQA
ncbi:MAG: tetratricopeptide repeat protein [Chitinophagales bacterium]|nr:tetratricopeptide repeat protein [Chitinophagales bacterium]